MGFDAVLTRNVSDAKAGNRIAIGIEEHPLGFDLVGPALIEVGLKGGYGFRPERATAGLFAFAKQVDLGCIR